MMSEFSGSFLTPSLPLIQILFTDPLFVKSEFHDPLLSHNSDIIFGLHFCGLPLIFLRRCLKAQYT